MCQTARKPILSRIARENSVDYQILAGRVGHIRDAPYAQFTVSLSGRDLAGVVAGLRAGGVSVKMNGEEDAGTSENRVPHLVREVRHVV